MVGLCLLTFLCQYNIFSNISIALLMKPFPLFKAVDHAAHQNFVELKRLTSERQTPQITTPSHDSSPPPYTARPLLPPSSSVSPFESV